MQAHGPYLTLFILVKMNRVVIAGFDILTMPHCSHPGRQHTDTYKENTMKSLILALLAFTLTIAGCTSTSTKKGFVPRETYINPGDAFPIQTLQSISGETISLDNNKKKLVILFSTWCSDSQLVFREVLASPLAQDKNLQIIGISRKEKIKEIIKFKKKYKVNFDLVADRDGAIYNQFANTGVPRLLLLNENNQLNKAIIGESPGTLKKVFW